jgi:hypothetical protein
MKKYVFKVAAFAFGITAAFSFAPKNLGTRRPLSTQTVFYNTGTQTNCPNSKLCSNINNATLCQAGVSTYYNEQATPCTATSVFKWKP